MDIVFDTKSIIFVLCCYIISVLFFWLRYYLIEKLCRKKGESFKLLILDINNVEAPINSKGYWITSLREMIVLIPVLCLASNIMRSLDETSMLKKIALGAFVAIIFSIISQFTAYCLYKLYIAKRKTILS